MCVCCSLLLRLISCMLSKLVILQKFWSRVKCNVMVQELVPVNKLYWAIQAGLLTPLTFARYRLSPLAAFTSSAYFLHNGRR